MILYMGDEEVIRVNKAFANKRYTLADFEAKPETVRVELIDGVIYYLAFPSFKHQELLSFIHGTIWQHIQTHGGTCKVIQSPFGVYIPQDEATCLLPDLMVLCDESIITQKGIHGGPDIVMEVVSPSSRIRDYVLKQNKYQKAGVREYWILDLEQKTIVIHRFETGIVEIHGFDETIPVSVFDGLEIDFSKFNQD